MLELETGYNTFGEDPRDGECYCHLLKGQRMCRACIAELCYCDDDRYCDPCLAEMRADPAAAREIETMIARLDAHFRIGVQLATSQTEERKSA